MENWGLITSYSIKKGGKYIDPRYKKKAALFPACKVEFNAKLGFACSFTSTAVGTKLKTTEDRHLPQIQYKSQERKKVRIKGTIRLIQLAAAPTVECR